MTTKIFLFCLILLHFSICEGNKKVLKLLRFKAFIGGSERIRTIDTPGMNR